MRPRQMRWRLLRECDMQMFRNRWQPLVGRTMSMLIGPATSSCDASYSSSPDLRVSSATVDVLGGHHPWPRHSESLAIEGS